MKKLLRQFEEIVVVGLLIMMMVVVFLTTLELGWFIIEDIMEAKGIVLDVGDILHLFSFFLLILIGLELIESIKMYLDEHLVHVEVVFLVAMIAIARKVIVLDAEKYDPITLFGIAALILSLSVGYYLVKKLHDVQGKRGKEEA